jgi:hypothetical protein
MSRSCRNQGGQATPVNVSELQTIGTTSNFRDYSGDAEVVAPGQTVGVVSGPFFRTSRVSDSTSRPVNYVDSHVSGLVATDGSSNARPHLSKR